MNASETILEVLSENDGFGDTVFGVPNTDFEITPPEDDEAATLEQTQELLSGFPDFNIQGDVRLDKKNGEFLDATLPGKDDDFPKPRVLLRKPVTKAQTARFSRHNC